MRWLILLFLCARLSAQTPATINIDLTTSVGDTIKPYIYGEFIAFLANTINHKFGLWAQEIDYRGFEVKDPNNPAVAKGWFPITQGNSSCKWNLDTTKYNRKGNYSQKIEITSYRDGRSGIGQLPIILESDKSYDVYLYLKASEIDSGVTLWLLDDTTNWGICDSVTFYGIDNSWKKFRATLFPKTSAHYGAFAITFQEQGTLWIDEVSLMRQSATDGVRENYFEIIKMLNPGIMRYPGGCFADGVGSHWLNGVGEIDQRPPNWDNHWGDWQRLDFGTDEFVQFCHNTNTEPQLTVNFGSGTPQEAANWVEYANGDVNTIYGKMRQENGHPEPYHIKYWEVGNEQYGEWEIGHTRAYRYATRFIDFANEMKAKDPSIKIIANGCNYKIGWTDTVLAITGNAMDYISIHFSCPDIQWDTTSTYTDQEIYQAVVAAPLAHRRAISKIKTAIDSLTSGNVKIAVTEWWMSFGGRNAHAKHNHTLETALYVAEMLNLFQKGSSVGDIANWTTFGAIAKNYFPFFEFYAPPEAYVLSLYANHSGAVPLSFTIDCPTYTSPQVGSIPPMDSVPFLDASVTNEGNKIYLNVVNRSLEDIETTINIAGGTLESNALVRIVDGSDFLSNNNDPPHDNVIIRDSLINEISEKFVYQFPAHSITEIELATTSTNVKTRVNSKRAPCLYTAYPNPFNSSTTISYQITKPEKVRLFIYNTKGQIVETLVDEYKHKGSYSVQWNAANLGSGIYFYKIEAGDFVDIKKCLIVK